MEFNQNFVFFYTNCDSINSDNYSCEMCNYESNLKVKLFAHIDTVHKKQQPIYDLKDVLKEYKCKKCNFRTFSMLIMMRHVLKKCLRKRKRVPRPKIFDKNGSLVRVSRILCCDHCSFSTTFNTNFKRHMLAKHPAVVTAEWFVCQHCGFLTKERCNLRRHTLAKHTNPEEKSFIKCDLCSYRTIWTSHLKTHAMTRHALKIECFKCHGCNFRTTQRPKLVQHIIEEHPTGVEKRRKETILICDQCPYSTTRKANMRRHVMAKHTDLVDVEWFECEHCDYKTKDKGYLKKHNLVKHTDPENIQWAFCEHCDFKTKTNEGLKSHLIKKHKTLMFDH